MIARIQSESIDVEGLIDSTRNAGAGAIVTFQGTVRRFSGDTEVTSLHYEAYEQMAQKQMDSIIREAKDRFGVLDVNVIHRLGEMALTEDTVVICVASEHRADAFEACKYVIDQIKEKVPIWKQDIVASGGKKWH